MGSRKYPHPWKREENTEAVTHVEKGGRGKARTLDCPLSAPHGFFPRSHRTCSEISLPEQQSGPRTTEGLSWPHLCRECAVFAPDFDLTLIRMAGQETTVLGPFGGMIRMRE